MTPRCTERRWDEEAESWQQRRASPGRGARRSPGSSSPRTGRSRNAFPIQSAPAPAARSVGVDEVLKLSRDRVSGSIAEIVLSSASSTQTAPAPTATLEGAAPSGTVARSLPVCGSSASAPAPLGTSSPPSRTSRAAVNAAARRRTPPAARSAPERRRATRRSARRGPSSAGSCARIARSSSFSSGPGSRPSSLSRSCRPCRYVSSASA